MAGDEWSSALVSVVEGVWRSVQRRHPDVPDVVVTLASGSEGVGLVYGHFAQARWVRGEERVHELFLGGEGLERGPVATLGTLLHEAAHGVACTRGVKDTSRGGRYHNARFRALAEELGIAVSRDEVMGWTVTTVPEATVREYAAEVEALAGALDRFRVRESVAVAEGVGEGRSSGRVTMVCECVPVRRLWMYESVAALGSVMCSVCYRPFRPQKK